MVSPFPCDFVGDVPLLGVAPGPVLLEIFQSLERSERAPPCGGALPADVALASESLADGVEPALALDADETAVLNGGAIEEL